ncbi:hypothetical protein [uncultured Tenacibaculum sp.]|uniref:hypothetical protein n=1 Tax=uncultured Tenacibaculum sp. TaxID=174713 RepID=UPI00262ADC37|nr:hypothetical protein [uncultured Tenacibaculum sp.]
MKRTLSTFRNLNTLKKEQLKKVFGSAIPTLNTLGYNDGYADGTDDGYSSGYDDGYDAGLGY